MGVVDRRQSDGYPTHSQTGRPSLGLTLISGPSRSGKSRWAEHLAQSSGLAVTYLATGPDRPGDGGWQQRLQLHRQRRPAQWATLEVGGELEAALEQQAAEPPQRSELTNRDNPEFLLNQTFNDKLPQEQGAPPPHSKEMSGSIRSASGQLLLIDSLGTWLAHHLDLAEPDWMERQQRLLLALERQPGPVLLVCEEVGWGVVPPTPIGGLFRDRSGSLQQRLMQQAEAAWLVVQGRALNLIALGEAVPAA